MAEDETGDPDEPAELREVPSSTALSGKSLQQDMDDEPDEEPSAQPWNTAEPVSGFPSAERTAEKDQSDDGAALEDGDEEELGIPPVPGAASRIVSG